MKKLKFLISLTAFLFIGFVCAEEALAVPNPNAVNWRASSQGFIRSLYVGVLGRQPENNRVVVEWAKQINNKSSSRRRVFWLFVNSPEYQKSRWAKLKKEYKIYYKWNKRRNARWTRSWWVSKRINNAAYRYHSGPYTYGVAKALRNYYAAYYPK